MKIAVVGGGSTYTPELLFGLAARAEALELTEVALMDIDPSRLEIVGGFIRRMCARAAPSIKVGTFEGFQQLEPAVSGADFVVTQLRVGGQSARLQDEQLGFNNKIIGQETTGVGGLAKALRTIPELLKIAKVIEAAAPQAVLINFTNPVSIVTEALLQHSKVHAIGLCNIPISQRMEIAAQLGVEATDVELDSVGLNHLSFVRGVRVKGEEVLPKLIADVSGLLRSGHKPANIPDLDFPAEVIESLNMIPSDYLRYYFLQRETIEEQQEQPELRAAQVAQIERALLDYYADEQNETRPELLTKRGGAFYSHAALEIISAIAKDEGARLIVDTRNNETVKALPPEVCVEVPCIVGAKGASPLPQAPLPFAIRGLIQHVKAFEQQAVTAALERSRSALYLSLLSHPLMPSAVLASDLTDRLIARLGW